MHPVWLVNNYFFFFFFFSSCYTINCLACYLCASTQPVVEKPTTVSCITAIYRQIGTWSRAPVRDKSTIINFCLRWRVIVGDQSRESHIFSYGMWHFKRRVALLRFCDVVQGPAVFVCAADIQPLPPQSRVQTALSKETKVQQPQDSTEQAVRFILCALNQKSSLTRTKQNQVPNIACLQH